MGQVHDWVFVEEVHGADEEVVPHGGHDGPVFDADDVMEAEGVPGDEVGVFEGAVGPGPGGEAFEAFARGDVDSGGVALVGVVGGDPELVGGEGSYFLGDVVG